MTKDLTTSKIVVLDFRTGQIEGNRETKRYSDKSYSKYFRGIKHG